MGQAESDPRSQDYPRKEFDFSTKEPHELNEWIYLFGLDSKGKSTIIQIDQVERVQKMPVPEDLSMNNYMGALYLNESTIFLAGGLSHDKDNISQEFQCYDAKSQSVSFLPPMNVPRYSFPLIYFEQKLFAIGGSTYGRNDHCRILKDCEYFDFHEWKWLTTKSLNQNRTTASAYIYNKEMYVMGGYQGQSKRSCTIEKYNKKELTWEIHHLQLSQGIEGCMIQSPGPNQLLVIGGKQNQGETNYIYKLDLGQKTIEGFKQNLTTDRVMPSGGYLGDSLFIFGGDVKCTSDMINIKDEIVERMDINFQEILAPNRMDMRDFTTAGQNIEVLHQAVEPYVNADENYCLFGTDDEPFIVKVNYSKQMMNKTPCPLGLRLLKYQGGCRFNDGKVMKYFIAGGLSAKRNIISKEAFLYDSSKGTVEQLPDMHHQRFQLASVFKHPHIYVFGGQFYGEKGSNFLTSCERFNIKTRVWETIGSLNVPRAQATAFIVKEKIYIAQGCKSSEFIEYYEEKTNKWHFSTLKLDENIEGNSALIPIKNTSQFLLIGTNDRKVWKYELNSNWGDTVAILKGPCYQTACYVTDDLIMILGALGQIEFFSQEECKLIYKLNAAFFQKQFKELQETLSDESLQTYLMI